MFSVGRDWMAQADISDDSVEKLRNPPAQLSAYIRLVQEREDSNKLDAKGVKRIRDLRVGLRNVSLTAVVVKKSEVRAVTSRDGIPLLVCTATLSDDTGEITLSIWNNQIGTVFEGDRIEIRGARVRSFRGQIQLSLGKASGLTILKRAKKISVTEISHLIAT
jgi:ssDNA-binding replication factor A large subunit